MKYFILIVLLNMCLIHINAQIPDSSAVKIENNDSIYFETIEKPYYKKDLMKFLGKNIRYPTEAHNKRTEGRVITSFIVEKNGSISNFKTLEGIGSGCDEEAKRVIALTNGMWVPAKQNGIVVRYRYLLPIYFRLP